MLCISHFIYLRQLTYGHRPNGIMIESQTTATVNKMTINTSYENKAKSLFTSFRRYSSFFTIDNKTIILLNNEIPRINGTHLIIKNVIAANNMEFMNNGKNQGNYR